MNNDQKANTTLNIFLFLEQFHHGKKKKKKKEEEKGTNNAPTSLS